jgi:hypothetical protein
MPGATMNYAELIVMWKQQIATFDRWKEDLFKNAEALRNRLEQALELSSKTWQDQEKKTENRYVEIFDITKEETQRDGNLSGEALTKHYELLFGISLTLDDGSKDNPKVFYQLPLATRYRDSVAEYALFDPQKTEVPEWESDMDHFMEIIFTQIRDYFNFDPYLGPRDDLEVGFLKKH